MRHKILVVDDRWDEREAVYRVLEKACRDEAISTPPSFELEIVFAENSWEVPNLLREHAFSAVILDIVLNGWKASGGMPVRAGDILNMLDDDIPVALLTAEWNSDEVKGLVADWPTKNCRMFVHWDDLEDSGPKSRGGPGRFLFELARHIEDYKKLDHSLTLGDDDPIRIVHLSDLQFGGFDGWKLNLEDGHCANTIRRHWPKGPTLFVITGDIAENGLPQEYNKAREWLQGLAAQFSWKLPSRQILIVPGNHDVCVPLATSSRLVLQKLSKRIKSKKKTTRRVKSRAWFSSRT